MNAQVLTCWQLYLCLEMDDRARARLIEKLIEAQGERSQRSFAKDLDISLSTLQNWIAGDSFPMLNKFEKIAAALGTSQEALFSYIVSGDSNQKEASPPAIPSRAEDVRAYASSISTDEKIRLLSMLGQDIAIGSLRDHDR